MTASASGQQGSLKAPERRDLRSVPGRADGAEAGTLGFAWPGRFLMRDQRGHQRQPREARPDCRWEPGSCLSYNPHFWDKITDTDNLGRGLLWLNFQVILGWFRARTAWHRAWQRRAAHTAGHRKGRVKGGAGRRETLPGHAPRPAPAARPHPQTGPAPYRPRPRASQL